jgi:hypothetical protein
VSFTIPPDSPKAVIAAEFGRELVKACRFRNVPLKELERVTGVGHTALDHYRRGTVLPKTEAAQALARTLDWPRLAEIIIRARTFPCARTGCDRTFRNDTGMCAGCEPEGVCRLAECPLRPFSPLPLEVHRQHDQPRTNAEIRVELNRKAAPKRSVSMRAYHAAHPEHGAALAAASAAFHAAMTPAERETWIAKIKAGQQGLATLRAPWTDERRANHLAGIRAASSRRRNREGSPMPEATP